MRATKYYFWELDKLYEWRVDFDEQWLQLEEYKRIKRWVERNYVEAVYGETYRISADAGYAAFLTEEEAMMFYIAFA